MCGSVEIFSEPAPGNYIYTGCHVSEMGLRLDGLALKGVRRRDLGIGQGQDKGQENATAEPGEERE